MKNDEKTEKEQKEEVKEESGKKNKKPELLHNIPEQYVGESTKILHG